MAAGDDERDRGMRNRFFTLEIDGADMAFEVVDRDERYASGVSDRFRERHSDDKRADEPRSLGHGESVDVRKPERCVFERAIDDRSDRLQMLPGRELGYDAAKGSVNVVLRCDHVRENATTVFDDGRRSLVARALDAEKEHPVTKGPKPLARSSRGGSETP